MLDMHGKPLIMGILNVTPDSFSDGGCYTDMEKALDQAAVMIKEGADVLDIGGESTRPGSERVNAEQQIERVVPVIEAIREKLSSSIAISIDTTLAPVAEAALKSGANIINDISAGFDDPAIFSVAAQSQAPLILMHMQGTPKTMQENPMYDDVFQEVSEFLLTQVQKALNFGVLRENIWLDPGIGFGKRKKDNLVLLAELARLVDLGFPVLLGTSRKRFMGSLCQVTEPAELVTATAVTSALGVMAGVQMFRVHDVLANRQAVDVAWAIKNATTFTTN